jgi:hypothetical protein
MLTNWEEYIVASGRRRSLLPSATLHPNGELRIGRTALEMLSEPEAIALLFDRAHRRIGLRRADSGEPNALRLVARSRRRQIHARYVYTKGFLNYHGIRLDRPLGFKSVTLSPEGYLVLDLVTAVEVQGRRPSSEQRAEVGCSSIPT